MGTIPPLFKQSWLNSRDMKLQRVAWQSDCMWSVTYTANWCSSQWYSKQLERKDRLQSCGSRTFLYHVMAPILNLWFFAIESGECPQGPDSLPEEHTESEGWPDSLAALKSPHGFWKITPKWEQRWTSILCAPERKKRHQKNLSWKLNLLLFGPRDSG